MIGRLLCWLRFHVPPEDVNPEWSLYWCCHRCGQVQPGNLSRRRR